MWWFLMGAGFVVYSAALWVYGVLLGIKWGLEHKARHGGQDAPPAPDVDPQW